MVYEQEGIVNVLSDGTNSTFSWSTNLRVGSWPPFHERAFLIFRLGREGNVSRIKHCNVCARGGRL